MAEKGIAVYIRLSLADEGTGRTKDESNSIVNQRSLIHGFLDHHTELSGLPRTEFVDDGYSGTTADRPSFRRMMAQIREGRFSACVSKDFSRIFRDYIEMGDCLEYLFPSLNVRCISINDGYDSNDYKGTTGGLDVVMRTIVYDFYSKDLSIKESTGKKQGRKKGRRSTGLPPYGYIPDPDRKSMDILDPEAAKVVRRIFDSALAGMNPAKIAEALNEEGILTPGAYYRVKNPKSKKYGYTSEKQKWTYNTVLQILKRYSYTGASVGNLRKQLRPCRKETVGNSRSEWIIVPDMHPAIVTEDEYNRAQEMIGSHGRKNMATEAYPLKSLVVCANCGRNLVRNKDTHRFYCQYGRNGGDSHCASMKSARIEDLEKVVLNGIRDYIRLADEEKKKRKQEYTRRERTLRVNKDNAADIQAVISEKKKRKIERYERYCDGTLDMAAYLKEKATLDGEIRECQERMDAIIAASAAAEESGGEVYSESDVLCDTFRDHTELSREMTQAFVDKLVIYPDNRMEIKWRFREPSIITSEE